MTPMIPGSLLHIHPMVLLFIAAVVLTLWNRLLQWWGRGTAITPLHLRDSITVIAVANPGESIAPYLQVLRHAQWPSRISLRIFKMLQPQETVVEDFSERNVHVVRRYGAVDAAAQRTRMLANVGSQYVLLLGRPMEAASGWDEVLLTMHGQCPQRRSSYAALTTMPPSARVSLGTEATFLCVDKSGTIRAREYAVPPQRPQPSLFASSQLLFANADAVGVAPAKSTIETEDALLSQTLWMNGVDFFSPHASVFRTLGLQESFQGSAVPVGGAKRASSASSAVGAASASTEVGGARTPREWALFSGKKEHGVWSRRAQLGLTPKASHEERFSKYGDTLDTHDIRV